MNSTQTVDSFETNGEDVVAFVTLYLGDLLENLCEDVDLTDGDQVVRDVRVQSLYVEETGRESTVMRLEGAVAR